MSSRSLAMEKAHFEFRVWPSETASRLDDFSFEFKLTTLSHSGRFGVDQLQDLSRVHMGRFCSPSRKERPDSGRRLNETPPDRKCCYRRPWRRGMISSSSSTQMLVTEVAGPCTFQTKLGTFEVNLNIIQVKMCVFWIKLDTFRGNSLSIKRK